MQYRCHIDITGIVQGVGFRPFLYTLCQSLTLCGWIRNSSAGVELEVQGSKQHVQIFLQKITREAPPLSHIISIQTTEIPPLLKNESGLVIKPSLKTNGRTLVSPDVATCPQCLHEWNNTSDRRYQYPFINCTHCGPRFTIITGLPYDRPATTMADFPMCPDCELEYKDPKNRRFHAQPIACPVCGPDITRLDQAISCLTQEKIVAIKGLGGFHLACRADSVAAVQLLRERKHRPAKPFAIMVPTIDDIDAYVYTTAFERSLLTSKEAPIVLLKKRHHSALAENIAPQNGYVGIMLPYTPLHHLLLQKMKVPLVMTSGNISGEPLVIDNHEAQEKLATYCDCFLFHNRPIHRRLDDSVMMVIATEKTHIAQPIRRSRGYVPVPVALPKQLTLTQPVMAAGGELKNVPGLAVDNLVFLTQHVGDLTTYATTQQHKAVIRDFEQLFTIKPSAIVCDTHPAYLSSRYARERAAQEHLPLIEVQHHHAHLAAVLAENNIDTPVLGLCFDGTGYGDDRHIWGGEGMIADYAQYQRLIHLAYLSLPGGDAAVNHPYRTAISYLHSLLPNMSISPYFPSIEPHLIDSLCRMVDKQFNTPQTSSMGRLFDAVSALLQLCLDASHEAEAPIALEACALEADMLSEREYSFSQSNSEITLHEMFQEIVKDIDNHVPTPVIAYTFHRTVAKMSLVMARFLQQSAAALGVVTNQVALSGGVWQNKLLIELTLPLLAQAGFDVLIHHQIPANDGGLAYGQIAVAAHRLKR